MDHSVLKKICLQEQDKAEMLGWDFSYIEGRYLQEALPWDYEAVIRKYLKEEFKILDCDTGGAEFLLQLSHPSRNTAATEGYPPNVLLCKEKLLPLGIDFKECSNPANLPYESECFDLVLNRHGSFDAKEIYRVLKKGGLFITQQVGDDNDRDLVKSVLPELSKPFEGLNLSTQLQVFMQEHFTILESDEAYRDIRFFDIGAFVWFAKIIEWEFEGFCVEKSFKKLIKLQEMIEDCGEIKGTIHRYYLVAKKE